MDAMEDMDILTGSNPVINNGITIIIIIIILIIITFIISIVKITIIMAILPPIQQVRSISPSFLAATL